jgi:hypothetical protein
MGWAARANPRSFHGDKSERSVLDARLRRFCDFFPNRQAYEAYLTKASVTDAERVILESKLPERLKVQGTV